MACEPVEPNDDTLMQSIESRMRQALLDLAMTAHGRTSSLESAGTTDPDWALVDDRGRGNVDAPHLDFAARWNRADDDDERAQVLADAHKTLHSIRVGRGDPSREESKADRDRRIVAEGQGMPARDVAVWARCSIRDVQKAREAAGRDAELGRLTRDARQLSATDRNSEIVRLTREGMNARQVAFALGCSVSTVLRALGRKDAAARAEST